MTQSPVLEAHGLSIGYAGKRGRKAPLHEQLHLTLYPGEMVCLLGPNGAGKSTLLRTLACFQPPLDGQLLFQGKPLPTYDERTRSRMIGVVLTDKTQTGGLTVYELAALGRQPHTGFFGRLRAHDREVVRTALQAVGIAHKRNSYLAELSDGERQKTMIAKALAQECPLILLDEPTAFLDVVSRIEVMQLLHRIAHEQGRTVLLSTHDVEQALAFADRLWLLSPQEALRCGTTEDLVFDGSLERLFPQERLRFDRERGGYQPVPQQARPLRVVADNTLLRHWVDNCLARYGFADTPSQATNLSLTARSPQEMMLETNTQHLPLHSFAELAEALTALPDVKESAD